MGNTINEQSVVTICFYPHKNGVLSIKNIEKYSFLSFLKDTYVNNNYCS